MNAICAKVRLGCRLKTAKTETAEADRDKVHDGRRRTETRTRPTPTTKTLFHDIIRVSEKSPMHPLALSSSQNSGSELLEKAPAFSRQLRCVCQGAGRF